MFIWLYGTYKNKEDVLVSEVERSLFSSIQTYYRTNMSATEEWRNEGQPNQNRTEFFDKLTTLYPSIDRADLVAAWDSSFNRSRSREFSRRLKAPLKPGEQQRTPIPFFMVRDIAFDQEGISTLNRILDSTLQVKHVKVTVLAEILAPDKRDKKVDRKRYEIMANGDIKTRPILIDLDKDQFISTVIEHPFLFILWKMSFQILTSILLLFALIGAFCYLFLTINRQNKMAILRKSFVNNMTHELKTPVATVMAAVEAVQRYGARDDKSKMEKYLDISHRELAHLSDMIERVLQLDMDEVSGIRLNRANFDLVELSQDCIETAKLHSKKPVHIDFQNNTPAIRYCGDASHIKNVLSNLLDNAIKYSGQEAYITIAINEYDKALKIQVIDQGQGIAPQYTSDIFDMFFRVPQGNLHTVKGYGIGLSYVKQIIEKHGGRISVMSKLNEGSTFTISLPKTP
jgi:signal transduction histidine kinase